MRERARERGVLAFEIASGDAVKSYDAARRAAAGYFLLLVQEKVTKEKDTPKPPKPPALLAEDGACQTAHPCAAGRFALPARTRATRGPDPPSAAMLSGGYGAQRQKQLRRVKSYVEVDSPLRGKSTHDFIFNDDLFH